MIVTQSNFEQAIETLKLVPSLGLDTETTGLRMYHGDRLFSIIIALPWEAYYFNFYQGKDHLGAEPPPETILKIEHLARLKDELFDDPNRVWFIQNAANFDMPILAREGIELAGEIHCTKAIGRVVRNDEPDYSLEYQLQQIGERKLDSVAKYVEEHKLYDKVKVPGKAQQDKLMHYELVPFPLMSEYGQVDGTGVIKLGMHQYNEVNKVSFTDSQLPESRSLMNVMKNERRLQKTIFRMKEVGVQIDVPYCKKAIEYENGREAAATVEFKALTGVDYKSSPKLFEKIFESERSLWGATEKGNPSFDSDVLARFANPAAKEILTIRDAKSKSDFYNGFLYHADRSGVLHPNYNPEGTVHGRFSSSNPNFQNLTSEDSDEEVAGEFIVRRAIVPREGYFLIMPDWDQMEYKFALELACIFAGRLTPLGEKIVAGHDFHDATSDRVFEVTQKRFVRKLIKNANFLTLYGGGDQKLADTLQIPFAEARIIRQAIRQAIPEINHLIRAIIENAEVKKYVTNWFGRRCHFANKRFAYKAPNYIISGGCADAVKLAMNQIDEYLLTKKSRLIMTVHDELPIEVHHTEAEEVPRVVHEIMQSVYKHRYIPLTVGMEFSHKSLGDKLKGFPV